MICEAPAPLGYASEPLLRRDLLPRSSAGDLSRGELAVTDENDPLEKLSHLSLSQPVI